MMETERSDSVVEEPSPLPFAPALSQLARLRSDPEDQQEEGDGEDEHSVQPDNQTLMRLLEANEKVVH